MDLFFFMFLLSIWVVAYGVAKQGILIHNEDRLNWIIRGAVYEPYLIIFGNFPTNIDSEQLTNFTNQITRCALKEEITAEGFWYINLIHFLSKEIDF